MKVIGILVTVIGAVVLNAFLNGWAFVKLYTWFVMPVFESAPVISIPFAIGIGMLVSLLTIETRVGSNENKKDSDAWVNVLTSLLRPVFVVFLGWIVTLFI